MLIHEVIMIIVQLLHRNVQRFRGGLVFKAHRLCVSLNSRLESNKEVPERSLESHGAALREASDHDLVRRVPFLLEVAHLLWVGGP